MKAFFSTAVKGSVLGASLLLHTLAWAEPPLSEREARQVMADEEDAEMASVPAGGITGLVERIRTGSSQIVSDTYQRVAEVVNVSARNALVMDSATGKVLYGKGADTPVPIASITKLMTAMVVADARLDMAAPIVLEGSDFEAVRGKNSSSKLRVGDRMNRAEALLLALMKSENPAAKSLARTYPGGVPAFVAAMNAKARALGMTTAFFGDPTGLDTRNVASPRDLAKMVSAAYEYGVIRQFSTQQSYDFDLGNRILSAHNTNALVRDGGWNIGLSKTGYISEAGRCVVMQAQVNRHPAVIVLMGANTSQGRTYDASRILSWLGEKFTQ